MAKEKKMTPTVLKREEDVNSARVKVLKQKSLFLYHTGKPFTLIKTGSTYELKSDYMNVKAFKGGFTVGQMNFIKRVKKHVIDNNIAGKFIDFDYQSEKINYISVKEFVEGEVLNDILEVDIDRAYWDTAYILGIIDTKIHRAGCSDSIGKKARLAALGSLARHTETWVYNGKDIKKINERDNPKNTKSTENLWFAICRRVSDVMGEAVKACGSDFVFYWVDGIYVRNNPVAFAAISTIFNKWGYECKSKYVSEIVFTEAGFTVQGALNGDLRRFTYPMVKRATISDFLESERLKKVAKEIMFKR